MATTALFIHSTATLPLMWSAVPAAALTGVTAIKPANLGYPPNPPLPRGTPFAIADDIRHVRAQVPDDDSPVHVLAHSYGGLVALELLPLLGARVASVYLFEPVMFGALMSSTTADAAAIAEATGFRNHETFLHDESRGGNEEWIEQFIDYWNRPGSWARMPEPLKMFTRSVGWKMFQEVRSVFDERLRFEQFTVDVPLTLVKTARSPAGARAMVDELARVNPHAVVEELTGTGHLAPLTHPAIFGASVAEHLERLADQGSDG